MAAGPCSTKSSHPASVAATCLISPPSVSSLTVERVRACSSLMPSQAERRNQRRVRSASSRSARSWLSVGSVKTPSWQVRSF